MRRAAALVALCVAAAASAAGRAAPAARAGGPSPRAAWAGDDDFTRAFAAARARGALVLVDVWAPW